MLRMQITKVIQAFGCPASRGRMLHPAAPRQVNVHHVNFLYDQI